MTNELHQLAGPYALDAVDDDERHAFEAHLEDCEPCRNEVAEFRETSAIVAGLEQATPPASMRSKVLAEVAQTRQLPPVLPDRVIDLAEQRRRRAPRRRALAAAAAVVVAIVGVIGVGQVGQLGESDGQDEFAQLLEAPDAVVTDLEGESGTLQVVWSAEQDKAAVLGSDLADPGNGQAYALWFLIGDDVAPAGLFVPNDGSVREVLDLADHNTDGWGITIEPDTGSEVPTSDVIFAGTL